jgi:energy-coupling factor transporter ATP-binding protein EcfA2
MAKPDPQRIKTIGKIEAYKVEIENAWRMLRGLSFWSPAAALRKECEAVLHSIGTLEEQLDRKLVATIIGPGGSGKSTLFNALTGRDDASKVGSSRPTTRQIVLHAATVKETGFFSDYFGPANVCSAETRDISHLENVILIDTPDVDSTRRNDHMRQVQRAVEISDVLLCVFNAENPKTKDHVDFFAPYIQRFHGNSLVGILNKCDRIDAHELTGAVLPEFETYVKTAWGRPLQSVFCLSARRHLMNPDWDMKAPPKHDVDQFELLSQLVHQTLSSPGYAVDRRLDNVLQLRDFMLAEVKGEIEKDRRFFTEAAARMKDVEASALKKAFSRMKQDAGAQELGINVLLYQKIAQRWVGPVGWMIAVWARILIFGTGMMAVFRFGNPIRQLLGIFSSLRHFKDADAAVSKTQNHERVGPAFQSYRVEILKNWQEIAELLIQGRFDKEIRNPKQIIADTSDLNSALHAVWRETLDTAIDGATRNFSHLLLQIVFNLPTVALLAHIAWQTARHYFSAEYLSSDFFIHAFLTLAVVLALSFFLFQALLRISAGPERMMAKAFKAISAHTDPFQQAFVNPVREEIDALLRFHPHHRPPREE